MFTRDRSPVNFVATIRIKLDEGLLAIQEQTAHRIIQLAPQEYFALEPEERQLQYFEKHYEQSLKPYIHMCARAGVITGVDAILFMSRSGSILINKPVDEEGYHKAVIYDELGMEGVTYILNKLQTNNISTLDLTERFELILSNHPNWYMSAELSELISESGDELVVKKLKSLSINQIGYVLTLNSPSNRDLIAAIGHWSDCPFPNAVNDFITEYQSKVNEIAEKFKSKTLGKTQ